MLSGVNSSIHKVDRTLALPLIRYAGLYELLVNNLKWKANRHSKQRGQGTSDKRSSLDPETTSL